MSRPAVFLDRDGTLNTRPPAHHYLCSADEFEWLPRAAEGAARLARWGYALAVVSNQRGLAQGLVSAAVLREIEERIQLGLSGYGCRVEAFRYCPHELDEGCACRKPEPGMLLELARDLDLDLSRSWMIGDSEEDVLAGQAAGCRSALIGALPLQSRPHLMAGSLYEVSELIATT
jgi:D-glycero-D-manno-heptose 1,7-bisphosphate phosphatase